MKPYSRVAIVGVGLIGGSIGQALRARQLADKVIGIGRRASSLAVATEVGAVDETTTDLDHGVRAADLVVVAAPVADLAELICEVAAHCPASCTITDAGSTKAQVVAEVERRRSRARQPRFVGSHPLAGDHHTGAAHARADLFEGNTVVVTPTAASQAADVAAIDQFWESLGATVVHMSPQEHDEAVAATSHVPHLVAFALAHATPAELGPLAGSGWRDTTRVAAADPALWQQIFATNEKAVLAALDRFDQSLSRLRQALANHDEATLIRILQEAKQTRDAVGN